jgi:hypothetical protein
MTIAAAAAMVLFAACFSFPPARIAGAITMIALPLAGYAFGMWRRGFLP